MFLFGFSRSCIHQQSPAHWTKSRGGGGLRGAEVGGGGRVAGGSQGSGGDLLHTPPLGQSGTAHWFQDWRNIPVEG